MSLLSLLLSLLWLLLLLWSLVVVVVVVVFLVALKVVVIFGAIFRILEVAVVYVIPFVPDLVDSGRYILYRIDAYIVSIPKMLNRPFCGTNIVVSENFSSNRIGYRIVSLNDPIPGWTICIAQVWLVLFELLMLK